MGTGDVRREDRQVVWSGGRGHSGVAGVQTWRWTPGPVAVMGRKSGP